MSPVEKKNVKIGPVLRAYTRASLRYPWHLLFVFLGTVGVELAGLIGPLYLRTFVNTLAAGNSTGVILQSLFALLVVYACVKTGGWIARRIQVNFELRTCALVMADLANEALENLIHHGHSFFTSNFVGTLTRRVTRYSRSYEQVLDSIAFNFLPTLIFAVGSIWVLYQRNLWLGTALLVWVLLFLGLQIVMTKWKHPLRVARAAEDSRMTGALSDVVGNQSAVALFASERFEFHAFRNVVAVWRAATKRSWIADEWMNAIQGVLAVAVEIGLFAAAIYLWSKGLVTVGDFVLIQVYVLGLIDQIWNIGNLLRKLYDAFADASEMVDILDTPFEVVDAPNATVLALSKGEIVFDDVTFGFSEGRAVLDHFNLTIRGGEKVALIGSSGAGKSTVTKVLLRLYDLTSGVITIDGQDIGKVTQGSLRENIAFVPQEPALFHRTLRENIRYGRLTATDEKVEEAARQAHCHEFIAALPEGYDTLVGERGIKLSGGERQRVAIARAILKNAPILILDEATSSLDSESEQLIQDALAKLMQGKTVIAIAHRLSTIMNMDRIVVVEEGAVALTGTHSELLAHESNLYKKLWEIQAGGFMNPDE